MSCRTLRETPTRTAFTLVELLVVVAIIILIVAFTVPAVNSVLRGSQLGQAGYAVADHLALARQTALAKNHSVEVRFYQYGEPDVPGEQITVPDSGRYRAVQSFEMLDSGSARPLGKAHRLASSVIIDSGATLSSLLDTAATPSLKKTWMPSDPQIALPRIEKSYNCIAFRFLPDGSTTLAAVGTTPWFLTVHNFNDGDRLAGPPQNFLTIQIDAANGHIETFRR